MESAISHYERKLLSRTFDAWKQDVLHQGEQWKKDLVADLHYKYTISKCCWQAWLEYHGAKRDKRQTNMKAKSFCTHIEDYFNSWRDAQIDSVARRHKNMASEMHARTTRLRRGIRAFVENRAENILERISEKKADEVYHKHQLARTWMYWRDSLYDKQSQDALIVTLTSKVDMHCQEKYLSKWVSRYCDSISYYNINQKATRHYTRMLKMKMIAAWLKYSVKRRRQTSESSGVSAIKRRYFTAWCRYIVQTRWNHHAAVDCVDVRRRMLLSRHFKLWHSRYQRLNMTRVTCSGMFYDAQDQYNTSIAQVCHTRIVKRHIWRVWMTYIAKKRSHHVQHDRAASLRAKWQLKRAYAQWVVQYIKRSEFNMLTTQINLMHRDVMMTTAWNIWRDAFAIHRSVAYRERTIMRLHWSNLTKCMFDDWYRKTAMHRRLRLSEPMADAWCRQRRLTRVMAGWHMYVAYRESKITLWRSGVRHHYLTRLSKAFKIWSSAYERKQERRLTLGVALQFRHRKMISSVFDRWTEYVRDEKSDRIKMGTAFLHWSRNMARNVMTAWRSYVHGRMMKKSGYNMADEYYNHKCKIKMIKCWKSYVSDVRTHMEEVAIRCATYRVSREKMTLYRSFQTWKDFVREHQAERRLYNLATLHYAKKLNIKCMIAWYRYIESRRIKNERNRIASEHCGSRLEKNYFQFWRDNFTDSLRYRTGCQAADTLFARRMVPATYSVRICYAVYHNQAWRRYVNYRKDKHEMYRLLLNWRTNNLSRMGVSWLIKGGAVTGAYSRPPVLKPPVALPEVPKVSDPDRLPVLSPAYHAPLPQPFRNVVELHVAPKTSKPMEPLNPSGIVPPIDSRIDVSNMSMDQIERFLEAVAGVKKSYSRLVQMNRAAGGDTDITPVVSQHVEFLKWAKPVMIEISNVLKKSL